MLNNICLNSALLSIYPSFCPKKKKKKNIVTLEIDNKGIEFRFCISMSTVKTVLQISNVKCL